MFKRFAAKFLVTVIVATVLSMTFGYVELAVNVPFTSKTVTVELFK